ncbi:MAG: hypothetical protein M9958_01395 [Chitinophagales bacterium]|nr:hypothetical protein [Chitinophagales bacterium]
MIKLLYLQAAMKKLPFFFIILLLCSANKSFAQQFNYTSTCQNAYKSIFKLKINEGKQFLFKEKQSNPNNYFPYFIENYSDFLVLYISDDIQLYKKLLPKKTERIELLSKGNKNTPYYLYSQSSIYLQWAFIKIKYGDYLSAVWDVKKAYSLLKTNKEKYPDFLPNDKDLALLNTLFGAIPDNYKFGAKLLGLKGDIDEGLRDLSTILKDPDLPFKEEASIMYTMLLLHLGKDKEKAWKMLEVLDIQLDDDNLLNYFISASIAHYSGRNEKVIEILSSRPKSTTFYPFPYLDFMLGSAKLNRLDRDSDFYLKKFLSEYKGGNYLRETNRKLAWYGFVFQRPDLYRFYISKIPYLGNNSLDEDKAATKEALSKNTPNIYLLKARLLSDGAYYKRALEILDDVKTDKLDTQDKLEYYYRKARILDDMGQAEKSINLYIWVINSGTKSNTYFAPNSCIKLGNYYESQKDKKSASYYYKKALEFSDYEYKNSIDAQAKAGLNRIQ